MDFKGLNYSTKHKIIAQNYSQIWISEASDHLAKIDIIYIPDR